MSYTEIARRIGRPRAVRAVGQAIGANPVAIPSPMSERRLRGGLAPRVIAAEMDPGPTVSGMVRG